MTIILDTDPGVDDMLALLLLLASENIDFRMITLTFGNCSLLSTLKNTLSLMKVVNDENQWRLAQGLTPFTQHKPAIHLGSTEALNSSELDLDQLKDFVDGSVDATDVHGSDGLGGIHGDHPEFDAPKQWFEYFGKNARTDPPSSLPFVPGGKKPAWCAIIDLLKSEPENTVSIVAVGPLTNIAKAAQYDPIAFGRVKQVLSMGASLRQPGNITPLSEFNMYADSLAAAKVYSLTSPHPSTMLPEGQAAIKLENPLKLIIFPLDITTKHVMHKSDVERVFTQYRTKYPESILLRWVSLWIMPAFANFGKLIGKGPDLGVVNLHDPLTAAYLLGYGEWETSLEDVRVETSGQWSRGATVVDDRGRAKSANNPHDSQKWITLGEGNQVTVAVKSPVQDNFQDILLSKILNF